MQKHVLVIDTETSGLPKKWDAPYSSKSSWPHVLQIAWLIYTNDGLLLKKENHYLKPGNFKITKGSLKIHHLTAAFLEANGEDRWSVFDKLASDISTYSPLVVAHFAELDFCMVGAEYHRLNLPNPLQNSAFFCTLKASAAYVKNPTFNFLKLNVFYKTLFKKRPENLHNAIVDAELTAEIFFHLLQKGEVNDLIVKEHSSIIRKDKQQVKKTFNIYYIMLIVVLLILIAIYYYGK